VSGGGYIGGWLSAFIHLKCNGRVEDAEPQLHTGGSENPAIRFLRSYSNYLTPKASVFSADTLTAVATYLRNLYLNLTLLLLALGGLLLLPRLLVWFVRWLTGWEGPHPAAAANLLPLFGGGILCIVIAMLFVGLNLGSRDAFKTRPFHTRQSGVLVLVVLPALLSAWLIAYGFYAGAEKLDRISAVAGGLDAGPLSRPHQSRAAAVQPRPRRRHGLVRPVGGRAGRPAVRRFCRGDGIHPENRSGLQRLVDRLGTRHRPAAEALFAHRGGPHRPDGA
jgi:hypothetical protein